MNPWINRIKSTISLAAVTVFVAVAMTLSGGDSAQAQSYTADSAVSSDGCYVYGTEHDWGANMDVTAIQAYGKAAIDSYTGADAGNLSSNCPTEVIVPSEIDGKTISWVGGSAFEDSGITSITIPSSIVRIGSSALYSQSLRSISIEGTPSIERDFVNAPIDLLSYNGATFRSSDPVTEQCFEFDASNGEIVKYKYLHSLYLVRDGFSCLSRNVVIPKTINGVQVTSIGYNSFNSPPGGGGPSGTPALINFIESISIPEGITTIKAGAFAHGRLKSVNIPSSVTSIDPSAFLWQSPYGSSIDGELWWSGDPVRAQAAYKTINYVQLVLADPSNPHGLMSASDTWEDVQDLNGNGQTDDYIITGGHITGASPVQLNFQDGSGNQLQPSQLITGETTDGTQLTSFLVADAPLPPVPAITWDPTPEELQAISDFLESTFFTNGRTFSYTAPVINGITPAPASFNGQLASGLNNINFIYATSGANQPENPTSGGTTSSGLADTGVNVWLFAVAGVLAMIVAIGIILKKRLKQS